MYKQNSQKKNIKNLLKKIISLDNTVSASVVGSFAENKNILDIGDLDIVIISNLISKKFINNCKSIIKKHKFKINKKLKINDSFGPLKYNKNIYFTVHLMVYDINGHIDHVIKSPFTCFDWERKNFYSGKSLTDIYTVNNLQLNDFFYSRRAINSHYKDLKKEQISTYSYNFKNKGYVFRSKKIKLDKLNKINYCKHIYKHSVNNFYKFWKQENLKLNQKKEKKFLINQKFNKEFIKKINQLIIEQDPKIIENIKIFLDNFFLRLKQIKKDANKITFIRHAKTNLNNDTFLGRRNVGIIKYKNKSIKKYDKIFSSPLRRSIQTAKKFSSNKIIINKHLKEINYGDAEGLNINQLKKLFPKLIKQWSLKKDAKFPNGENLSMVIKRINKFKENLFTNIKNNKSKNYLVVTHNVFIRCLIGHYFKIKMSDWHKLKINHLTEFNFILLNKKLIPNINRKTLKKVINFKINELSSTN